MKVIAHLEADVELDVSAEEYGAFFGDEAYEAANAEFLREGVEDAAWQVLVDAGASGETGLDAVSKIAYSHAEFDPAGRD